MAVGPLPVDPTGVSTLEIAPGHVPLAASTACAHLMPIVYFGTASTPPVAVVLNTDVLGVTLYTLSDVLKNMPSF